MTKMKTSIIFGLFCTLLSEGAALTCKQCIPAGSQTCIETETSCSVGSCGSMTIISYAGGTKVLDLNTKSCLPSDQCISGSLNLGISRTTISTMCCKTDRCNSQKTPELNPNSTLNGMKCFTCERDDCTQMLSCVGNEDRCIKTTTEVGGQRITMKGCASRTLCMGETSAQLGSITVGLSCCEGNLCNSAKSVGQSALLLLGSLIPVLLFQ